MTKYKHRKPKLAVDRRKTAKTHGTMKPSVIVLHTTESHDREGATDVSGILTYLEGKGLGVHFCLDGDGNLGQGSSINKVVYHAAGANSFSIGIEMIGFAKFNALQWKRRKKQLRKLAILLAWLHIRTGIPLKRSKVQGIAYHRDFPGGGHWDPGYNFPIHRTLRLARKYVKQGWVNQ